MLNIQRDRYQQQIEAYELYNESQNVAAERARNELIQIEQTLNRGGASVPLLGQRGVARSSGAASMPGWMRWQPMKKASWIACGDSFERALITEGEYSVAKLELRKMTLEQEMELLRQGTQEEIRLAAPES
jgi:hypothetical protein